MGRGYGSFLYSSLYKVLWSYHIFEDVIKLRYLIDIKLHQVSFTGLFLSVSGRFLFGSCSVLVGSGGFWSVHVLVSTAYKSFIKGCHAIAMIAGLYGNSVAIDVYL